MTTNSDLPFHSQNEHYIYVCVHRSTWVGIMDTISVKGPVPPCEPQYSVLKVWLRWQFWYIFLPPISPSLLLNKKMLGFSIFLFSPLFHPVLSFTVCWAFDEDSVSRRLTVLRACVYLCVYTKVRQGVYPRWWWQNLICFFFLFFSLLCVSSAILKKCVRIHLCKGPWLLRCDAPYHHFLYITHICLEKKIKYNKKSSSIFCVFPCWVVLYATYIQKGWCDILRTLCQWFFFLSTSIGSVFFI